jgi:hypothetical protein
MPCYVRTYVRYCAGRLAGVLLIAQLGPVDLRQRWAHPKRLAKESRRLHRTLRTLL